MSAHGPDPSDLLPMVGDIVERNVDSDSAGYNSINTVAAPALRPIAAVVGRAFPVVRTRRAYGRPGTASAEETCSQSTRVPASPASIPASRFTGLSAHVQPQDGETDREGVDDARAQLSAGRMQVPENGREAVLPAGGSAQQRLQAHQWSAAEFAQLRRGYYVAPVSAPPSPSGTSNGRVTDTSVNAASPVTASAALSTHDAAGGGAPPTGEDFFKLLFQCLRSTVRKHQQLALEVLLDHLRGLVEQNAALPRLCEEAAALRERCLHGPNCGPFLFFVLEILVSAGHPAMVELAATSLLLLLRNLPSGDVASGGAGGMVEAGGTRCVQLSLFTDAVSEIGNPAGDAPSRQNGVDTDSGNDEASSGDEDTADGENTGKKKESALRSDDASAEEKQKEEKDDAELPFSAVSELLRGADARYGLEEMGFTNKVLATMQLLVLHSGENDDNDDSTKSSVHLSDRAQGDESQRLAADSAATSGITSSSQAHLSFRHAQVLFLELLLCGGVGIGQRAACRRVAQDPQFLSWMEGQLSAVVLGQRSLDSVMELLCVLQHLAHVPAALRSLLRGGPRKGQNVSTPAEGKAMGCENSAKSANRAASEGVNSAGAVTGVSATTTTSVLADAQRHQQRFHETWLLFFLYVCSTTEQDVRTVRQVFTLVWSMLFLRACTRQGRHHDSIGHGLVHDLSDTLLTEGMSVGAAIVLEMEFLQYANAGSKVVRTSQPGSLDTYFFNVAQSALQLFRRPTEVTVKKEADSETAQQASTSTTSTAAVAAAAQTLLRTFQWISCGHFLSTYLTTMRRHAPAVCFTLCGSAVETQEAVRDVVRHVVLSPAKIQGAFARFTSPLLSFTAMKETATEGEVSEGWRGAVITVLHRWTSLTTTATALTVEKEKGAEATNSVPTVDSTTNSQQQQQEQQSCAGTVADEKSVRNDATSTDNARDTAVLRLSFEAAALYANTRAAVALADVYPAVARDLVVGYAGMLSQSYQDSCLRLRDGAAQRLQVDELCTMAEAVQLLQRYSSDNLTDETTRSHGDVASGSVVAQPRLEESNESRGKVEAAEHGTSYNREARLGAFFLLHSIAISKHCLDVVPLLLPLVQLPQTLSCTSPEENSPAAIADSAMAQVALMASLQAGIECTPVPWMMMSSGGSDAQSASVALTGAPRSWVVYPLYDASLPSKAAWARWLRGLLGLHRRVKDVVGWDAVLCHTLLWMLTHRRALWASPACASESTSAVPVEEENEEGAESEEVRGDPQSAAALCGLVVDLCAVLHDHDGGLSAAACRTLEVSLTAYSDVPSEDGLPLLLHAVVAYVAGGHSSARVALAALQLLLATPVLPTAQRGVQSNSGVACDVSSSSQSSGPAKTSQTFSLRTSFEGSSVSATAAATVQLCDWLQRWSVAQRQRVQAASSAHWSLEDVVALLQLIGPSLNTGWRSGSQGRGDDTTSYWTWNGEGNDVLKEGQNCSSVQNRDALWCVRCLADGLLGYYVQQRRATSGALSAMEKAVLQSTLGELDWYPAVLWPHVAT